MKSKTSLVGLVTLAVMSQGCGKYEEAEPPPVTLTEPITIVGNTSGDEMVFSGGNQVWELYETDETLAASQKVAVDSAGRFKVTDDAATSLYVAVSEEDTVYLSERHIPLEGANNLRDAGGLFNQQGYQMKWNMLYRSDKLSGLTDDDLQKLSKLNVQTICDFRMDAEVEADPDKWPDLANINRVRLPIGNDSLDTKDILKEINSDDFNPDKFMEEANREFILTHSDKYREFFALLRQEQNYPLLYHCSAGKDRTGMATLLLFSALGIDRETAIDEYLMTNVYLHNADEEKLKQAAAFYGIDSDKLRPLMGVKENYINAGLHVIDSAYGSVENYLCEELQVCDAEVEWLKRQLLYDYDPDSSALSYCQPLEGMELPKNCASILVNHPLSGARNFRVPLFPEGSEVQVPPSTLYRSDALHNLTSSDVAYLETLGIKTIVDFRYREEIAQDPNQRIGTVKNYINLPISRGLDNLDVMITEEDYTQLRSWFIAGEMDSVETMLTGYDVDIRQARIDRYRSFALDYTDAFGKFLKVLAEPSHYPIIYHCQGGKDRTGFATAILLKTLGFSTEDIVADYLTTNLYDYEAQKKSLSTVSATLIPSIGAHGEQILASLKAIDQQYGNFSNYLKQGLKLTDTEIVAIRENILQPHDSDRANPELPI
ncbi:MAG: tyrosine-protein phosphatase [Bacteroidota bacterium]